MISRVPGQVRNIRKAVSAEDTRRRREERTVAIRRNKRLESLQKRRHMIQPSQDASSSTLSTGSAGDTAVEAPKLELLGSYLAAIDSQDAAAMTKGTNAIRRLLSIDRDPPVDAVIRAGTVPKLVSLLSRHDAQEMQFEAAWALTNIASGTTEQTRAVVDGGATPIMVQLLRSPSANVREQCVWCLGNISGEGARYRDLILAQPDAVNNVLLNIAHPASESVLQNATWTLSNLFRGKPQPDLAKLQPAMAAFPHLLQNADVQVVADACWALSYLSDGDEKCVEAVVAAGLVPLLVPLMERGAAKCVVPALRTIGNVVSGSDRQTQAVLDAGAMPRLLGLLNSPKRSVRKEACWTLSNIAAGTATQAAALTAAPGALEAVAQVARTDGWDIRKEAGWTLFNLCTGGFAEHAHAVAQNGGIRALSAFLVVDDISVLNAALDAFREILRFGEEADRLHDYVREAEEAEMLDRLEALQDHEDEGVYSKAQRVLEDFFDVEDDGEGENAGENGAHPAPAADVLPFGHAAAPQFSFGAPAGTGGVVMPAGGFSFA